ncbi:DUF3592 domain-containing protein [Corynebacterium aquatimens]|uniref:DUF3592 domain-containing protein n=1 Tax=Corynebacterium aquatimens TaxID=1190508 RepID=A0A931E3F9_9CORY|nr:DUF3592 domain-containing protein [Corynebacterium aquatimens]MBG6121803.1 hypothetical protein [Corynebacterium aquatimens]WJY65658.1 hypothetical protein CAQUA_04725 [Corynebacterium aquatimens]
MWETIWLIIKVLAIATLVVCIAYDIGKRIYRRRGSAGLKKRGIRTSGKVVHVRVNIVPGEGGYNTEQNFDETIEFRTHDGRIIRGEPRYSRKIHDRMGEEVEVFYDPHNPENFIAPVERGRKDNRHDHVNY